MANNTEIWDLLCKTDPAHTKSFKRSGGFSGTAIKPIWTIHRMTEVFGPCGKGWGIGEPTFQVVHAGDEILVYCTASIWHGARDQTVFGVGGDKAVGKFSTGLKSDDEAFKKAFTDAVTNALKFIGASADVHMGMFDDSKYVTELKAEFAEPRQDAVSPEDIITRDDGIQVLTVDAQRPIFSELQKELSACEGVEECKRWKVAARRRASRLSEHWRQILNGLYLKQLREFEARDADEYIERVTA